MLRHVDVFRADLSCLHELPLLLFRVPAGFPSPAEDYTDQKLDLNKRLISDPDAMFFMWVKGDSMIKYGIFDGDLICVNRALTAISGDIVVASINGDATLKRFVRRGKKAFLMPGNDAYAPIELREEMDFSIWGVLHFSVRMHREGKRGRDATGVRAG